MSIRANSLQSVLVDSIYYAAVMGFAAFMLTVVARGDEPRAVEGSSTVVDRRLVSDHIDSQLNTDDNMPSGNPEESSAGKREAMMLGMKLYERHSGSIYVDDVAATSPAWDAGIRPGDQLISIDGLTPNRLAPWVDDVGKVLQKTPDGKSVAAEVIRNGEKLALRVRLPVSNAAQVRDARQEERAIADMHAGRQQPLPPNQQTRQPALGASELGREDYRSGYGGYGLGGYGLGGFFVDDQSDAMGSTDSANSPRDDRMANNAIARLMAVNTLAGGNNRSTSLSNVQSSGGQVGLAAFQNTEQGVHAVVAVRGLPQGTYHVGIGQGDALAGGFGSDAFGLNNRDLGNSATARQPSRTGNGAINANRQPVDGRRRNQAQPIQQTPSRPGPIQAQPGIQAVPGNGQQAPFPPRPTPGGGAQPATPGNGSGESTGGGSSVAPRASLASPHGSAILAQQMGRGQMQNPQNANPGLAPGTFQDDSGLAPGTFPNKLQDQSGSGNNTTNSNPNDTGNSIINQPNPNSDVRPTLMGILRVGANGSGRLENVLEGVQVRNLAGMNVTIYSDMAQGGGPITINQQETGIMNRNAQQSQRFPQNDSTGSRNRLNGNGQLRGNQVQSGLNGAANQGIVATGVIQIMEGNFPGTGQAQTGTPTATNNSSGQVRQQLGSGQGGASRQNSSSHEDFNPAR